MDLSYGMLGSLFRSGEYQLSSYIFFVVTVSAVVVSVSTSDHHDHRPTYNELTYIWIGMIMMMN